MRNSTHMLFAVLVISHLHAQDSTSYFLELGYGANEEHSLISISYKNIGLAVILDTIRRADTMICDASGCEMQEILILDTNVLVNFDKENLLEGCARFALFDADNQMCKIKKISVGKGSSSSFQAHSDTIWGDITVVPGYNYKVYYRLRSSYNSFNLLGITGSRISDSLSSFSHVSAYSLNGGGFGFPYFPDSTNLDSLKLLMIGTWNWFVSYRFYEPPSYRPTDSGLKQRTLTFTSDSVFFYFDGALFYSSEFALVDSGRNFGPIMMLPIHSYWIDAENSSNIQIPIQPDIIGPFIRINDNSRNCTAFYLKEGEQPPAFAKDNDLMNKAWSAQLEAQIHNTGDNVQIRFKLERGARVTARIIDSKGRIACNAVDKQLSAGEHIFSMSVASLSAGLYWMHMQAENMKIAHKILIMR